MQAEVSSQYQVNTHVVINYTQNYKTSYIIEHYFINLINFISLILMHSHNLMILTVVNIFSKTVALNDFNWSKMVALNNIDSLGEIVDFFVCLHQST